MLPEEDGPRSQAALRNWPLTGREKWVIMQIVGISIIGH